MPSATTRPPPTRLSPLAVAAHRAGFACGVAGFAAACVGLYLLTDAGAASSLASTPLAASFRALISRSPYLLGGLFNISMFGSVLCLVRLQEHAAAPLPVPPPPKSRQERRQLERDVKSHLRAAGARVWDGKKGE